MKEEFLRADREMEEDDDEARAGFQRIAQQKSSGEGMGEGYAIQREEARIVRDGVAKMRAPAGVSGMLAG